LKKTQTRLYLQGIVGDVRILLGLGYAEVGVAEDVGDEDLRGKGLGAGSVPELYSVKTERENSATHQSDYDRIFRIENAKITTQMRPKNNLLETRPKLTRYVHGRCKTHVP
jgi:hypothetical protein